MNDKIGPWKVLKTASEGDIRMKSVKRATGLIFLFIFLLQAFSQTKPEASSYLRQAEVSETGGTVHIVANSPRPLAQVLDALHIKHGWVVDYEDPRFTSKLDSVAATDPQTHAPTGQLLPAGGRFSVEFPLVSASPNSAQPAPPPSGTALSRTPQSASPPSGSAQSASSQSGSAQSSTVPPVSAPPDSAEEEKAIRLLVDAYNRSDNPGRFELRKNHQGNFYVVGIAARDAKDQISPQKAILDSPITLARQKRNATATLNLMCQRTTVASGTKISIAVSPRNLLDFTPVTVGATKAPARDVLLQVLSQIHGNCYWRLLFDPTSKAYYLDLHAILPVKNSSK